MAFRNGEVRKAGFILILIRRSYTVCQKERDKNFYGIESTSFRHFLSGGGVCVLLLSSRVSDEFLSDNKIWYHPIYGAIKSIIIVNVDKYLHLQCTVAYRNCVK